ncbi:hypothetical protein [Sphingomonas endolithica]|nr:hypothetical protein [Sphingomonas sp. ZFBP2030]
MTDAIGTSTQAFDQDRQETPFRTDMVMSDTFGIGDGVVERQSAEGADCA